MAHQFGAYDAWDAGADTPANDSLTIGAARRGRAPQVHAGRDARGGAPSRLKEIVAPFADHPDVHLVVRLHYPGMDLDTAARAVELFAAEVMPALKAT